MDFSDLGEAFVPPHFDFPLDNAPAGILLPAGPHPKDAP